MQTHQTAHTHETSTREATGIDLGGTGIKTTGVGANARSSGIPLTVHPDAVTVNKAAALAGVCRRTIYAWIARGLVETRYTPGGALRIVVSSLLRTDKPEGVGRTHNFRRHTQQTHETGTHTHETHTHETERTHQTQQTQQAEVTA